MSTGLLHGGHNSCVLLEGQLRHPNLGQLHYPSGQLLHPTTHHHHHLVSLSSSSLEAWGGAVWMIKQIEVVLTCQNRQLGSSVDRALVSHFDIQKVCGSIPTGDKLEVYIYF